MLLFEAREDAVNALKQNITPEQRERLKATISAIDFALEYVNNPQDAIKKITHVDFMQPTDLAGHSKKREGGRRMSKRLEMSPKQAFGALYKIDAYLDKKDSEVLSAQFPISDAAYERGYRAGASAVIDDITTIMEKYQSREVPNG